MKQDQSYRYFKESLQRWLAKEKAKGESPQKLLALKVGVADSTVSRYVNNPYPKGIGA